MRKRSSGFTLVEIMIVVAIIGILIAIAIPGFIKARTQSQTKACQENLQKIDGAKEQCALETNLKQGDAAPAATVLFGSTNYLKVEPLCPAGNKATYVINTIGTNPDCPVVGDLPEHALPTDPAP